MEELYSVSKVKKLQGTYKLKIEGYSGLSTVVGESIESPEFNLCGHTWQLRIFPGGSLESHRDFVSFYLASKSNRVARASYKLIVKNQTFDTEDEVFISSGVRIFEAKGIQVDGWGRDKFMRSGLLNDTTLGFKKDDCVIFMVEIAVYGDLVASTSPNIEESPTKSFLSLELSLYSLYLTGNGADITIYTGQEKEKLFAHKCILIVRSEVFQVMFSNIMKESILNEIEIPDFDFYTVKEMLHFIYTDKLTNNKVLIDKEAKLFYLAVKYQIFGLISLCENFYISNINEETVIPLLNLSLDIDSNKLKQKSMQFLAHNINDFNNKNEFFNLEPQIKKEIFSLSEMVTKSKKCGGQSYKDKRAGQGGCLIM